MQNVQKIVSKIKDTLSKDPYFTNNVGMNCLGGRPIFEANFARGSRGAITWTTSNHTYWSPSVAALVHSRFELVQVMNTISYIIRELGVELENKNNTIPAIVGLHEARAFSSSSPNLNSVLDFEPIIVHYNEIKDEDKTNYEHPFVIEGIDFKSIENENQNPFPAAVFMQQLFGQIDYLFDALIDDNSIVFAMRNKISETNSTSSYLRSLKFQLDMIESRLDTLFESIESFLLKAESV